MQAFKFLSLDTVVSLMQVKEIWVFRFAALSYPRELTSGLKAWVSLEDTGGTGPVAATDFVSVVCTAGDELEALVSTQECGSALTDADAPLQRHVFECGPSWAKWAEE